MENVRSHEKFWHKTMDLTICSFSTMTKNYFPKLDIIDDSENRFFFFHFLTFRTTQNWWKLDNNGANFFIAIPDEKTFTWYLYFVGACFALYSPASHISLRVFAGCSSVGNKFPLHWALGTRFNNINLEMVIARWTRRKYYRNIRVKKFLSLFFNDFHFSLKFCCGNELAFFFNRR